LQHRKGWESNTATKRGKLKNKQSKSIQCIFDMVTILTLDVYEGWKTGGEIQKNKYTFCARIKRERNTTCLLYTENDKKKKIFK
jgi:hypothetical protein